MVESAGLLNKIGRKRREKDRGIFLHECRVKTLSKEKMAQNLFVKSMLFLLTTPLISYQYYRLFFFCNIIEHAQTHEVWK